MTRRSLLQHSFFAAAGLTMDRLPTFENGRKPVDRQAVVGRHNVKRTEFHRRSPLQVGNGRFAFGADLTGLQTFVPFNTMSEWAWYHAPLPKGQSEGDYEPPKFEMQGKMRSNEAPDPKRPALSRWLYANPSKINLGRIGLLLTKADGTRAAESDLQNPSQTLDLWTGTIRSTFTFEGRPMTVTTACHPSSDTVAVRIEGGVGVFLEFPAPDGREFCDYVGTAAKADDFPMVVLSSTANELRMKHDLGKDSYHIGVSGRSCRIVVPGSRPALEVISARYGTGDDWADVTAAVAAKIGQGLTANTPTLGQDPAPNRVKTLEVKYAVDGSERQARIPEHAFWIPEEIVEARHFRIEATGDTMELVVGFAKEPLERLPTAAEVLGESAKAWPAFWRTGGAIDLSESRDPRWRELERRVVLSQYLMAVNEAGDLPPQESGLVNNGWHGKYHMEMIWWHAAHYALWNRWEPWDAVMSVYDRMLPSARAVAKAQDYAGARWTKMAGPEFRNSPHICNGMLAWQQPHPLFFAELEYRARPTAETLEKWQPVIESTADFMASYVWFEDATGKFNIGPPLSVVSELNDYFVTKNPAFELTYWHMGLRLAQKWRERQGLAPNPRWKDILAKLAPLPVQDGVYVMYEGVPDMWTKYNRGHPEECGIYGWLPGDGVDIPTMRRTLAKTHETWRWPTCWGWDFPLMAMCAARLGKPEMAVDYLFRPEFGFDDAGLAVAGPDAPSPYFPSNGGLLYAVAMMAAGWDGAPKGTEAPGFPKGEWVVRFEGLWPAL
jgi:hypothetical protein